MPTKGMRHLLLRSISRSSSSPSLATLALSPSPKETFGSGVMSDRIAEVESIITKWETQSQAEGSNSARHTTLFQDNRDEGRLFLRCVADLNHFMQYLKTSDGEDPSAARLELVRMTKLMEVAMKRLQREFFRILSANRDRINSDSVRFSVDSIGTSILTDSDEEVDRSLSEDDENRGFGDSPREMHRIPGTVMVDLRSIANCMVANGYAKECVKAYTNIRKAVVDEGISRLGFEKLTFLQIHKLDPATVEHWIRNWLKGARIVVKTLFAGERSLCDFVFSSSEHIKESCFAEITRDAAGHFLEFPELVAASSESKMMKKKLKPQSHAQPRTQSPERIYYLLDLHNSITDLLPDVEKVFSYHATLSVRAHALTSLQKIGESVRRTIDDLEHVIQKDTVKEPPIPGGGVHPLTCRVMEVLTLLSDYSLALDDIYVDQPLPNVEIAMEASPCPSVSARFAWLVLVLLCKLDGKAEMYKDMSLSYLFLANNLQYVVKKVSGNKNLRELLGEAWVKKHEEKAKSFVRSHERIGWSKLAHDDDGSEVGSELSRSDW